MKTNTKLTIIVCVTLTIVQALFLYIPISAVMLYNMAIRPLVYVLLTIAIFVFAGMDYRPNRRAYMANIMALVSVLVFGVVFLTASLISGMGINPMAPNLSIILRNLWENGSIVILGGLIRYKLIKNANPGKRHAIIIALTIALAFSHMSHLRMVFDGHVTVWYIFFEAIFMPIVISAVASYFAVDGSFFSVALLKFVYIMIPYLAPVLPDVTSLIWSLITTGLLFLTVIVFSYAASDKRRAVRLRNKRYSKVFAKNSIFANMVTVSVIAAIIAFFLGAFPIYPIAILSDSMEDMFSRGSLVFVERVPEGRAFDMVGEGEVIHFIGRTRTEYIHRVVDFRWNENGEREYITQGDANPIADSFPVPQENVLGIARAQLPFMGFPYIFVQSIFNVFR